MVPTTESNIFKMTASWIKDVFFSACKAKGMYTLYSKGKLVLRVKPEEWDSLPKYTIPSRLSLKEMAHELSIYKDQLFQKSLLPRLSVLHKNVYKMHSQHFYLRHGDGKIRTKPSQINVVHDVSEYEPVEVKSVSTDDIADMMVGKKPIKDNYIYVNEEFPERKEMAKNIVAAFGDGFVEKKETPKRSTSLKR
jgi:hypothetical protein